MLLNFSKYEIQVLHNKMFNTQSSVHQALPTDMTHYRLLNPIILVLHKTRKCNYWYTTTTPVWKCREHRKHHFIHTKSTLNTSATAPLPLLGTYPESQEPSTPLKVSITNVILFNLFTQTEFSHSKSLLKERVAKCLEKPRTALVGS